MINNPKISIIIPVYNGANYLREAIDSALAQTYSHNEVIVVNDGSTDNGLTEEIALSYGNKIRYFIKPNGGVASALNKGISEMTGEYFSWLSHDDLYLPNKLSEQVNILLAENNPTAIIYSDFSIFYDNNETCQDIELPSVAINQFRYFLTLSSSLHGCTLLIPKSVLLEFGGFNETLRYTQDYDLWFRLAKQYPFIHIPLCLVKGRQHAEQDSVKMQDTALLECNALYTGFLNDLSVNELLAAEDCLSIAYAKLAMSLKKRGINQAWKLAEGLAISNLNKANIVQVIKTYVILFKGYVINPILLAYYLMRLKMQRVNR